MSGYPTLFGFNNELNNLQAQINALQENVVLPLVSKGDVLTRDSTHNTNLAVGINNQVLTSNSATDTGLAWNSSLSLNNVTAQSLTLPAITQDNTQTTFLVQNLSNDNVFTRALSSFTMSGPTGPAGPIGSTGATGNNGSNGTNGTNGSAGSTGPTGANGANGSNGTNGTNGSTGPTGPTGLTGSIG